MTTPLRRFYCEVRLTAPYQTPNGPIDAGSPIFMGNLSVTHEAEATEILLRSFKERSPFSQNIDVSGKAAEIEAVIQELSLDVALSIQNMSTLPAKEMPLVEWEAREVLVVFLKNVLGTEQGTWDDDDFSSLEGSPISILHREARMEEQEQIGSHTYHTTTWINLRTLCWEGTPAAVVAHYSNSDGGREDEECLILSRSHVLRLIAEILDRRGGLEEARLDLPIPLFNVRGLELHNGVLQKSRTPV